MEAWAKNYAADGLEVIGVHTPEYAFEHVPSNVAAGVHRLGLTFPVALDNSYSTWKAYDNQSWPAAYLIDSTGEIRHISIGEGDYPSEESLIRRLLQTAHPGQTLPPATEVADTTPQDQNQSPETYLGSDRAQFHDGGHYANGRQTFTTPSTVKPYYYGLGGAWKIGSESITSASNASITLRYHASKAYLDVGGTGTLTVDDNGVTKVLHVSRRTGHLHRRRSRLPGERHGHDPALTRPERLLLHLRLSERASSTTESEEMPPYRWLRKARRRPIAG